MLALVVAPVAVVDCRGLQRRHFQSVAACRGAVGGGVCWLAATLALTGDFLGNQMQAPVQGVLARDVVSDGIAAGGGDWVAQVGGALAVKRI